MPAPGTERIRKLWVHADNAPPQMAQSSLEFLDANGIQKATHPRHSRDLALIDVFYSGKRKQD
jgi:hypothetical protein